MLPQCSAGTSHYPLRCVGKKAKTVSWKLWLYLINLFGSINSVWGRHFLDIADDMLASLTFWNKTFYPGRQMWIKMMRLCYLSSRQQQPGITGLHFVQLAPSSSQHIKEPFSDTYGQCSWFLQAGWTWKCISSMRSDLSNPELEICRCILSRQTALTIIMNDVTQGNNESVFNSNRGL